MALTSSIATNLAATRAHNAFEKNNVNMSKAMDRVTTGLKINSAQDNGSNWLISEKMRERINSLNQASQNIQNDTAMLKTAEGGITNTVDILRSAKALVVQATDASTNDNDRLTIVNELTKLFEQIDYNAQSTKYNGKVLLTSLSSGDAVDYTTGLGLGMSAASAGPAALQFQIGGGVGEIIGNVTLQNMTLTGLNLYSGVGGYTGTSGLLSLTTVSAAGTFFRPNGDGLSGTGNGDTLLKSLDTALDTALKAATKVGAYENRLGYTADNVATQIENLEASDSTIRDADMAKEISNYMKYNVLSQAAQYMMAQANQNAFSVLNLLQ